LTCLTRDPALGLSHEWAKFFLDEFNFPIKKNINIFKFIVGILFYNIKNIKLIFFYVIKYNFHRITKPPNIKQQLSYLLSIFLLMNPNFCGGWRNKMFEIWSYRCWDLPPLTLHLRPTIIVLLLLNMACFCCKSFHLQSLDYFSLA
jgi:hypothetical protein